MSEEHTMNWTCEQIEARLGDYVDGLLQPAERAAFEAHAAQHCERCAPLISSVTQLVSDLHGMESFEPPPRLVYAILDKTLGPRDTVVAAPGFFGWLRGIGMPRFAYGALSLSATFLVIASASGFSWRHPKLADLQPATIARNADRQAHLVFARGSKFVSDLRVVYEIQTRLRQDNELPTSNEDTVPATTPNQAPGRTDGSKPAGPNQQNRATTVNHNVQLLATTFTTRAFMTGVPFFTGALSAGSLFPGVGSGRKTR
jgi:anti-sigma factor RsiW